MDNIEVAKEDLRKLDPNFYKGKSTFNFPNGDSYNGDYYAHRSGLVWREGFGTYTTKDKQVYKGTWKDDRIVEEDHVEIAYPNGNEFYGYLENCKYTGPGMYVIDNLNILCTFTENKPTGDILLIDGKGKEWTGTAQDNYVFLTSENNYMNNISKYRGRGKFKKIVKQEKVDQTEPTKRSNKQSFDRDLMKEMEMKIFAKTKKTLSNLRFEDSEWYRNYENFKAMHDTIMNKEVNNELNNEESEWLQKYLQFKKKYTEIMTNRKVEKNRSISNYKLFDLYNSTEYKNTCPAVSVFYPRQHENETVNIVSE